MNVCAIVGRLGGEVELKKTPDGKSVANFTVATNEGKDKVCWHRVVVWDANADNCAKYLSKGKMVAISGRIDNRTYDKDGEKRYISEIIAMRVDFLTPKTDADTKAEVSKAKSTEEAVAEIPF